MASALAVLPPEADSPPAAPPAQPLTESLGLPRELALPVPTGDPASRPGGGLPALVALAPPPRGVSAPLLAFALLADALAAGALGGYLLRSRAERNRRRWPS